MIEMKASRVNKLKQNQKKMIIREKRQPMKKSKPNQKMRMMLSMIGWIQKMMKMKRSNPRRLKVHTICFEKYIYLRLMKIKEKGNERNDA